jgi:hypothetical protein
MIVFDADECERTWQRQQSFFVFRVAGHGDTMATTGTLE